MDGWMDGSTDRWTNKIFETNELLIMRFHIRAGSFSIRTSAIKKLKAQGLRYNYNKCLGLHFPDGSLWKHGNPEKHVPHSASP